MSDRASLRGGRDILSRRLSEFRALIIARGSPSWVLSWFPNYRLRLTSASLIPRVFSYLRKQGVSVVSVHEFRTLNGLRVSVGPGVEWLLLSKPVLFSHSCSEFKPHG